MWPTFIWHMVRKMAGSREQGEKDGLNKGHLSSGLATISLSRGTCSVQLFRNKTSEGSTRPMPHSFKHLYLLLAVPGHASLWLSVAEFEMKGKRKHTFMMCLMSQCLLVYNILCCTFVCEYVHQTQHVYTWYWNWILKWRRFSHIASVSFHIQQMARVFRNSMFIPQFFTKSKFSPFTGVMSKWKLYKNTTVIELNVVSKFESDRWRTFGDLCLIL
jgi:hypothetical protein